MFQHLLQSTLCIAVIFASVSCSRKTSIEDEEFYSREFKALSPREGFFRMRRPGYQRSHESKREGEQLPEVPCAPYPEVVQVEPDVTGLKNIPQFIRVNRCKGACRLPLILQKCEPTKMLLRSVKVFSEDSREYVQDVQDHVECVCTCQVNCNENQIRDDEECKCTCKEKCKDGEMQNPKTCECIGEGKRIIEF